MVTVKLLVGVYLGLIVLTAIFGSIAEWLRETFSGWKTVMGAVIAGCIPFLNIAVLLSSLLDVVLFTMGWGCEVYFQLQKKLRRS